MCCASWLSLGWVAIAKVIELFPFGVPLRAAWVSPLCPSLRARRSFSASLGMTGLLDEGGLLVPRCNC